MTEVACFCGCCYGFQGPAGTCPRCGAVATAGTEPVPRDEPGASVPGTSQVSTADLASLLN